MARALMDGCASFVGTQKRASKPHDEEGVAGRLPGGDGWVEKDILVNRIACISI
jgi:hypothetical protein